MTRHQDASRTQVLFVAGASGTGKTSVSFEVSALLRAQKVAHALVDGDNLDASYPGPPDDGRGWVTTTNLTKVWGTYRELGQRRLVYVNTVSVLEAASLRDAVDPEAEIAGVLLLADPDDLASRLAAREQGSEREEHLRRSAERSAQLDRDAPDWVVRVPTTGRGISDIAQEVVELLGWCAPGPRGTVDVAAEEPEAWV